jgi:PPIC-type PPIASE domain
MGGDLCPEPSRDTVGFGLNTRMPSRFQHLAAGIATLAVLGSALFAPPFLRAQGNSPSLIGLRIIVVGTVSEAQQILERLKKGEDFAILAQAKSTDATASDGGYMGKIDPATLRGELRDALAGLKPGQTTGIIKLPSGYAIVRVLGAGDSAEPESANPARILPLAATGSISYGPSVGGKGEADLAFRSFSKPEGWSQDLRELCEIRKKSLSTIIDELEKNQLTLNSEGSPQGTPLDQVETHYALANLYAYKGVMDKAVEQWQAAYQIASAQLPSRWPLAEL